MKYQLYLLLVVITSAVVGGSLHCTDLKDKEKSSFTYKICSGTSIRNFTQAQIFCQMKFSSFASLVTFPSQKDYDFLIQNLSLTRDKDFRFFPGFYQISKNDRYNPETGLYFWITDPKTQITSASESYWSPFSQWIVNFNNIPLQQRQYGNFLMDKDGIVYPAVLLGGTLSEEYSDPSIICMMPNVEEEEKPATLSTQTDSSMKATSIELWVIIIIAAGSVIVLIAIGLGVWCFISKRNKRKFEKVPSKEPQEQHV